MTNLGAGSPAPFFWGAANNRLQTLTPGLFSQELAGGTEKDTSTFVEVVYLRLLQSELPQHNLIRRRLQSKIAALQQSRDPV